MKPKGTSAILSPHSPLAVCTTNAADIVPPVFPRGRSKTSIAPPVAPRTRTYTNLATVAPPVPPRKRQTEKVSFTLHYIRTRSKK